MATNCRTFDGVDDKVTCSTGSVAAFGPATVAAIVKFANTTDTKVPIAAGTDPNSWAFYVDTDESLGFYNGAGTVNSAASFVSAGSWWLIALSKASGNVAARFHAYNYSSPGWAHANAGAIGNSPSPTNCWLGADTGGAVGNAWIGDMQVLGFWTSALSDGTIESLVPSLAAWEASSPAALWPLTQASTGTAVQDTVGGADQTALVGTTVGTGNPDWDDGAVVSYGGGGMFRPGRSRERAPRREAAWF